MPASFDSEGKLLLNGVPVLDETPAPKNKQISDELIGYWYAEMNFGMNYFCSGEVNPTGAVKIAHGTKVEYSRVDRGLMVGIHENGKATNRLLFDLVREIKSMTKELRKMTKFWGEIRDEYVKQRAESGY